ncbi:hypothetical protein JCM16358_23310 [Halanaerocella petrolearia]
MENLIVYQKAYDMTQYGYQALKQFPRSEKYTFVAEIKETMVKILRMIITTNKKYYKKTTMQKLDAELEVLKTYIRLARDLEFLPFKKYEIWSKKLHEIGKLIGGWLKSIDK